jgi:hypothetical protein
VPQELFHVLFDHLTQQTAGSPLAATIERLYRGFTSEYVNCLTCGASRDREVLRGVAALGA